MILSITNALGTTVQMCPPITQMDNIIMTSSNKLRGATYVLCPTGILIPFFSKISFYSIFHVQEN